MADQIGAGLIDADSTTTRAHTVFAAPPQAHGDYAKPCVAKTRQEGETPKPSSTTSHAVPLPRIPHSLMPSSSSMPEEPSYSIPPVPIIAEWQAAPALPVAPLQPLVPLLPGREALSQPQPSEEAVLESVENEALLPQDSEQQRKGRRQTSHQSQVWEAHKNRIRRLYLDEGKTLVEVVDIMSREHNFNASIKQYKTRIRQWKLLKNNTRKEVSQLLRTRFLREALGKRTEFIRHGKAIDIDTYLRRKGLTEYDIVDLDSPAAADALMRAVRCQTPPDPQFLDQPGRLKMQESFIQGLRRTLTYWLRDPKEYDYHWLAPDLLDYTLEIQTAAGYATKGDVGKAVQRLNLSLSTSLRDFDVLDSAGALYLLLAPPTLFRNSPMLVFTLYKYLAAFGTIKAHPLSFLFNFVYNVARQHGAEELYLLMRSLRPLVLDELERILGARYELLTRVWSTIYEYEDNRQLKTWMLRDQIRRDQEQAAREHGTFSPQNIWAVSCYTASFPVGSEQAIAAMTRTYAQLSPGSNVYSCQVISHRLACFLHQYHTAMYMPDPSPMNMRKGLMDWWATEMEVAAANLKSIGGNPEQPWLEEDPWLPGWSEGEQRASSNETEQADVFEVA